MLPRISCAFALWLGVAGAQTPQRTVTVPARPVPRPATQSEHANVEPVILTRSLLDEKVVVLRVAPRIATSIRLPEPVNSVVVGDPENFEAEHSEREQELVTVKPVTDQPAQTNLLVTTTEGHQLNLLLVSLGQQNTGTQPVDVLLAYGKPKSGSFLVEESSFPTLLIAETTKLGGFEGSRDGRCSGWPNSDAVGEFAKDSGQRNTASGKKRDGARAEQITGAPASRASPNPVWPEARRDRGWTETPSWCQRSDRWW